VAGICCVSFIIYDFHFFAVIIVIVVVILVVVVVVILLIIGYRKYKKSKPTKVFIDTKNT